VDLRLGNIRSDLEFAKVTCDDFQAIGVVKGVAHDEVAVLARQPASTQHAGSLRRTTCVIVINVDLSTFLRKRFLAVAAAPLLRRPHGIPLIR